MASVTNLIAFYVLYSGFLASIFALASDLNQVGSWPWESTRQGRAIIKQHDGSPQKRKAKTFYTPRRRGVRRFCIHRNFESGDCWCYLCSNWCIYYELVEEGRNATSIQLGVCYTFQCKSRGFSVLLASCGKFVVRTVWILNIMGLEGDSWVLGLVTSGGLLLTRYWHSEFRRKKKEGEGGNFWRHFRVKNGYVACMHWAAP